MTREILPVIFKIFNPRQSGPDSIQITNQGGEVRRSLIRAEIGHG